MADIVELIDWLVRKAIVATMLGILVEIIQFILYIIQLIQDNDDTPEYLI